MSDRGSELPGKYSGINVILIQENDCIDIIFASCDNHGMHNSFRDGLKFIENPLKYKKYLYKFR